MNEEEKDIDNQLKEVLSNKDKREWLKLLLNVWYGGNNNE